MNRTILTVCLAFATALASADPWVAVEARKDSPQEFNLFLWNCSLEERVCLMQALMGLEGQKIEKHHFGRVKGLKAWDEYADKKKNATVERPLRPKTYNDVSPVTVVDAIERAILPEKCVSRQAIRKELLWTCCNKTRYHFLDADKVDYHKEALQWVCRKQGIPETVVASLGTMELERKLVEKFFEKIWDGLTPERRTELLAEIEAEKHTTIANKAGIAAMSGGAAIAALGTTVAFTGFAFYTTMSSVMATVAGWCGATLPFAAYTSASGAVAVMAGPVGWTIAGLELGGGAVMAGWPDSQRTMNFVIASHMIKQRWMQEAAAKGFRDRDGHLQWRPTYANDQSEKAAQ